MHEGRGVLENVLGGDHSVCFVPPAVHLARARKATHPFPMAKQATNSKGKEIETYFQLPVSHWWGWSFVTSTMCDSKVAAPFPLFLIPFMDAFSKRCP